MAIVAETVTVTTTPVLLVAAGSSVTDRRTVLIRSASGTIYLGGADVDSSDGFPFDASDGGLAIDVGPDDDLWAVAASSQTVRVMRTRT